MAGMPCKTYAADCQGWRARVGFEKTTGVQQMTFHIRHFFLGAALAATAACSLPADVDAPQISMGNFRLGHNIVVVDNPEIGPFSREAEDDVWKQSLVDAIDRRFGAYEGDKFYHIGTKMDMYVLALPGVPLVFTPKSVLVVSVNIWDDAAGEKVNEEGKALTIFEGISAETLVSSGLTQNKNQQMLKLSNNMAKAIQDWILENPEWVGLPPLAAESGAENAAGDGDSEISETTLVDEAAN